MRKLYVNENDANQRVDKFLLKTLPTLPKSLMYKYIRNKKIKLNGSRCEISTKIQAGDEFTCYISDEFFEIKKDASFLRVPATLDILYEDENILVMNKEKGLLAHSDDKVSDDTLINRMKHYLYKNGEYDFENEQSFAPALCHRIDRNTQGIVIGAKNAQALRDVNEAIRLRNIDKYYLCIVEGTLTKKKGKIKAYHKKENQKVSIRSTYVEGYTEILTGYEVVKEKNNLSLLKVKLYSGKSHQIRSLFAHMGHPLYGDGRYGAKKRNYDYQALCAYRIVFHDMSEKLAYLNEKAIMLDLNSIEFMKFMK